MPTTCPYCNNDDVSVIDSRPPTRWRECNICKGRWSTKEVIKTLYKPPKNHNPKDHKNHNPKDNERELTSRNKKRSFTTKAGREAAELLDAIMRGEA